MTDLQVLDIARSICSKLGIKINEQEVLQNMQANDSPTTIKNSNNITIWIDRHFISISHDGEIDVHYIYLSRKQLKEELLSITKRLKTANNMNDYILLTGIERQMHQALDGMLASNKDYHIFNYGGELCQLYQ